MTEKNFRTLTMSREITPELRLIPSERIVDHQRITPPRPAYTEADNKRLAELAEKLQQRQQPAPVHVLTADGGISYFLIDKNDWDVVAAARRASGRDQVTGHHLTPPYLQALIYYVNETELSSFKLN